MAYDVMLVSAISLNRDGVFGYYYTGYIGS